MVRCIALLSGGLDSMLAIRLMQDQDIEVEALNFKTMFTCCQDTSAQAARSLGVPMTIIGQEDDYLDLVREPQYGYGKGANPCVDCRIYMFERARTFMEEMDAQFIISGEVVGQRPMSQKRRDLDIIATQSDLEDLLLRPLSAKLLPPTLPEREGWVDRELLYGIQGRSRKLLIEMAKNYGFPDIPTPSTGCALTEPEFGRKVHDLIQIQVEDKPWDYQLLTTGRHFRFDDATKVILGRDQDENRQLRYLHTLEGATSEVLLDPENFKGPLGLVSGPASEESIRFAAGLLLRYSSPKHEGPYHVQVTRGDETQIIKAHVDEHVQQAQTISMQFSGKKGR